MNQNGIVMRRSVSTPLDMKVLFNNDLYHDFLIKDNSTGDSFKIYKGIAHVSSDVLGDLFTDTNSHEMIVPDPIEYKYLYKTFKYLYGIDIDLCLDDVIGFSSFLFNMEFLSVHRDLFCALDRLSFGQTMSLVFSLFDDKYSDSHFIDLKHKLILRLSDCDVSDIPKLQCMGEKKLLSIIEFMDSYSISFSTTCPELIRSGFMDLCRDQNTKEKISTIFEKGNMTRLDDSLSDCDVCSDEY